MIRTILESSDHAEKVAKTIGTPRWLRHALKRRYAENSSFFYVQCVSMQQWPAGDFFPNGAISNKSFSF